MPRNKSSRLTAPEECPVCGEEVPPGAMACPTCGADHNSGWKEDAGDAAGLNLPDDDFRYDEWVKEEFGNSPKPAAMKPIWWVVAIILLIAFAALYLLAASR